MRRLGPALLAIALLPALLLWPMPLVLSRALVTSPLSEGPAHLWGWWAAWQTGSFTTIHTDRLNHPDGLSLQLIDPLHAWIYALGAWWSPAAGFNLVLIAGLAVAGLGGALLAREAGAEREGVALGAIIGLSAPTVLAVAADGITEGMGVGWVAVQLALLLSMRRGVTAARALGLAGAVAAGVWTGPYNALFIAAVDLPVGLALLRRTRAHLLSAAAAAAICAPYLHGLLQRSEGLPGTAARAGLGQPTAVATWRGGLERGVDLLDLFVPAPLTGAFSDLPHTAYLGVVTLALAGLGARRLAREGRRREAWCWLGGAAAFAALALGPWISVAGQTLALGERPLLGPAGLLSLYTPLGRLSRWYRAGAVAVLLLAPLAAVATRGPRTWLLALAVLIDARLLAPLPWRFDTVDARPSSAMAQADGPIAELPPVHPLLREDAVADLNLLLQVWHGQPTSGTIHAIIGAANSPSLGAIRRVAALEAPQQDARKGTSVLAKNGYRYLAVYRERFPVGGIDALVEDLGPPLASDDWIVLWRINR